MKTTYCNPLDLSYRYSHMNEGKRLAHREGADPTLVFFKGTYYAFVSMSAGFWYSKDLLNSATISINPSSIKIVVPTDISFTKFL